MSQDEALRNLPIAVLGDGAVGKTCAADCVLGGNTDVRLFELPEFFELGPAHSRKRQVCDQFHSGQSEVF